MDRRILQSLVRSVLLFLLSIVLVAGFYFHSAFYSVGLYPLLLIGGFVTFLVILGARLILLGELPRGRPSGELTFGLEEGDRVQRQIVSLAVLPVEGRDVPVVGQAVRGRYETGIEFGRLLVVDVGRKFLSEITEEEAKRAGYRTVEELRAAGAVRFRWRPDDVVAVLGIRPLGVRA